MSNENHGGAIFRVFIGPLYCLGIDSVFIISVIRRRGENSWLGSQLPNAARKCGTLVKTAFCNSNRTVNELPFTGSACIDWKRCFKTRIPFARIEPFYEMIGCESRLNIWYFSADRIILLVLLLLVLARGRGGLTVRLAGNEQRYFNRMIDNENNRVSFVARSEWIDELRSSRCFVSVSVRSASLTSCVIAVVERSVLLLAPEK